MVPRFSPDIVSQAIKNSGNFLDAGTDDISIHHLKYLGPLGLQYLIQLYNLSINYRNILAIWKNTIITPIPKLGKQADLGTSYQPISLLCPAVKVLEHFLQPELNSLPLSPNQDCFRPNHSTVSALLPLVHRITQGFNQPRSPPTPHIDQEI